MALKAIESSTAVIGNVHLVYDKDEADREIRRQKRKRCLAMAMWCWSIKELNRYGDQDYMDFADKWRKRWLELADKFKEAMG